MDSSPEAPKIPQEQDFVNTLLNTLNMGSLALMISIGHRSGLFDQMDGLDFMTVEDIAQKANLNERYVQEWLGAVVTGDIVEYDTANKTYKLPIEKADYLTRRAGKNNIAVFMQYTAVLGKVEDDILECFKKGGGIPYSKFHRLNEVMAEDSGPSVLYTLEKHMIPSIPGLEKQLETGIKMLDLGCGSGKILNQLSSLYPNTEFVGIDLSEEAIETARTEAAEKGLQNVDFQIRDLSGFLETAPKERFDFITTFDAVHNQAQPLNLLKGINRTLKSDGVYLMQDISGTSDLEKDREHPIGPFLYTISCMHRMTVSLSQDGEGLGAMWGEENTHQYLKKAGFQNIQTHKLEHDIKNTWYVVRK